MKSCPTLSDPGVAAYQAPLSVGILQAMVLERAAIALSDFLLCKIAFGSSFLLDIAFDEGRGFPSRA